MLNNNQISNTFKKAFNPKTKNYVFDNAKEIGIVLYEMRQELNLTAKEVAYSAGIEPSYLSLIENGKKLPSIDALFKIANVLNDPSLSYIFFRAFVLASESKKDNSAENSKLIEELSEVFKKHYKNLFLKETNNQKAPKQDVF